MHVRAVPTMCKADADGACTVDVGLAEMESNQERLDGLLKY